MRQRRSGLMRNVIVNPPCRVRLDDRSWPPAVRPACRVSWAICGRSSRNSSSISRSSIVIGVPAADSETTRVTPGAHRSDGNQESGSNRQTTLFNLEHLHRPCGRRLRSSAEQETTPLPGPCRHKVLWDARVLGEPLRAHPSEVFRVHAARVLAVWSRARARSPR